MIDTYISEKKFLIQKRLNSFIPKEDNYHSILFEASNYSLSAPCKRLRPILTLATTESLGADIDLALTPACAIELIHTYSLIHDDLPCMDDDDLRRGIPSLHKKYPESTAVLTGDYLLTLAFETLTEAKGLTDAQKLSLIQILSKHSGSSGIIGGQIVDLAYEGKKIDEKILDFMHKKKTASLFIAALQFGAIIANAKKTTKNALTEFGNYLGIAFQIIDDILDVTSTDAILGKPAKSDFKKKKANSVTLFSIEGARKIAHSYLNKSLDCLSRLPKKAPLLEEIVTKLIQRNY